MRLLAQVEGLAVPATMPAVYEKDTLVYVSGDKTVTKAGADADWIGRVSVPAKAVNGIGTVETRCKELIEIKASGALAAGALVKLAARDGGTDEDVAVAYTALTDDPQEFLGIVWNGGGSGDLIEVLTF